jgi:TolB-like protein/DNA-binding winged helix-turn-helix (wHTH) protein
MLLRKVAWYDFDNFRLDVEKRRLLKDGVPLMLSPKTVQTLLILVENAGETVEKDEIYNQLWADSFVEEGNLTQYIYVLRKSLGRNSSGQSYIETVARQGYRFTAQIKTIHAEISVETNNEERKTERFKDNSTSSMVETFLGEQSEARETFSDSKAFLNGDKPSGNGSEPSRETNNNLQAEKTHSRKWFSSASLLLLAALVGASFYIYFVNFSTEPSSVAEEREIKSIAILPFKAIGEESANESLGLGMTDAIITRLSKLKQIPVRPTSAVFRFVDTEKPPETIGRDLSVDAILEGTVQRSGDLVRVSVRLIRVETSETIWAERFDGAYTHIFKVQDTISEKVVDSLALNLSPAQNQNIAKRATDNVEAYQAYALGLYFWNKRTKEALDKAERYFQRAVELDPNYAKAYAGLADTYNMLVYNHFVPPAEVEEKAKNAAVKAIELDDTLAEGHLALAQIQFVYDKNVAAGVKSLERAIELSPYNATAHLRYGWQMFDAFRLEKAEREIRLAQEYDPFAPINNVALCNMLLFVRKYDEAVKFCERGLEIDRQVPMGRISYAEGLLLLGRTDEALAAVADVVKDKPDDVYALAGVGYVFARAGNGDEAVRIVERLENQAERKPYLYPEMALINYTVGRKEDAFEAFGKAIEKDALIRVNVVFDPRYDEIKKDPDFIDLIARHGLSLNPSPQ